MHSFADSFYQSPQARTTFHSRKLSKIRKEEDDSKRLEVEAEMSVKMEALMRKFVNFREELRDRYGLSQRQLEECLGLFRKLSL